MMMPLRLLPFIFLFACTTVAPAATVSGAARLPRNLTHPSQGYVGLYEWNVWITPYLEGASQFFRVAGEGAYNFTIGDGHYTMLMHQPEWHLRPAVHTDLHVATQDNAVVHLTPGLDYSMYAGSLGEWGHDPWAWSTEWHQTFVARGTSITKVAFKMAGTNTDHVVVSIHQDNGAADVRSWPQVGASADVRGVGQLNDNWVGWLSGSVPTEPGARYAVRLHDAAGERGMGILIHRDSLGHDYAEGTAYHEGAAQPFDLHLLVGSDSDGLLIAYGKRYRNKPVTLAGAEGRSRWGQTWRAKGTSLAAMDLFAANGGDGMYPVVVRVRREGPQGSQVGPDKRGTAAWWGPGSGIVGISWPPGQVPLVAGERYYIEVEKHPATAPAINPFRFVQPANAYAEGTAFMDGMALNALDLDMTIVEYEGVLRATSTIGLE